MFFSLIISFVVSLAASPHVIQNFSIDQLEEMEKKKTEITWVDARKGVWDDGRRIPMSRNKPAYSLSPRSKEGEIKKTLPNVNAMIILYCANGACPASEILAVRLMDLGYKNVYTYPGGIREWADEREKPIIKVKVETHQKNS